jgi:hypothetical protein
MCKPMNHQAEYMRIVVAQIAADMGAAELVRVDAWRRRTGGERRGAELGRRSEAAPAATRCHFSTL